MATVPIDMDVKCKVNPAPNSCWLKSDWLQQETYKQQLEVKMSEQQLATLKQKLVPIRSIHVAQTTLLPEEKKDAGNKGPVRKTANTTTKKLKLAQEQKLYITNRDNMILAGWK